MFIRIDIDYKEKKTIIKKKETTNVFIIKNIFLRKNYICENYILTYEIT